MSKKPSLPPFTCDYTGWRLAGVDEVGRGPLIGAVVTAAVILDPARPIAGLADSKNSARNVATPSTRRSSTRQRPGVSVAASPMKSIATTSTRRQ